MIESTENTEMKDYTGLMNIPTNDTAANAFKDRERDLTNALLKAAEFCNTEEAITEIRIQRGGEYFFSFHVRPLSEAQVEQARKKARRMMKNPNGRKLPPIEREFKDSEFASWLIYLATVDEEKNSIWGNKEIKEKYELQQPTEAIDKLLLYGEKTTAVDTILEISGMRENDNFINGDDDEVEEITPEAYAKN